MTQPPDRDASHHPDAGRPPEYVIEAWVSHQLRDKIQRLAADPTSTGMPDIQRRAPEPELEAEP
jgi:hypothetical protein